MIFLMHALFLFVTYVCKKRRKRLTEKSEVNFTFSAKENEMDAENNVVFEAPVYLQRYAAVQQVLVDRKWSKQLQKVVDFGCAEFGFFPYLKRAPDVVHVLDVDIDKRLLEEKWTRVCPLNVDYLVRRSLPLQIEILVGSISDPDPILDGVDAVIGIEIIEHLFPDTLDALPYNIFSYVKPKVAIFTTPNADFNVLFTNFSGIRHADHKFEWSRKQFEDWCQNIVLRYPYYTVSFKQVGDAPEGKQHLGGCSQMAIFELQLDIIADSRPSQNNTSHGVCTYETRSSHLKYDQGTSSYYELLRSVEYPVEIDDRTPEQKALDEMKYQISKFTQFRGRYYDEEENVVRVPVREVISSDAVTVTEIEARELLRQAGFVLEECLLDNNETEICVIYDLNMEECAASTSDAGTSNSDYTMELVNEDSSSWNWDLTSSAQNDDWLSQNEYNIAKYPYQLSELEFYYAQRIKELEKELANNSNQTVSEIASNKELNSGVNYSQSNQNETRSDACGLANPINLSNPSASRALSLALERRTDLVVKGITASSRVADDVFEVRNEALEVERFSREVLFDSDSQAGLLSALFVNEQESDLETNVDQSLQVSDENTSQSALASETETVGTEDDNAHDEPHFYCQGDGLGIHPSIADMGFEDDTTSDESAGSGTYEDNEEEGVEENVDEEETLSELEFYTLPEECSGYDEQSAVQERDSSSTGRTYGSAVGSGIILVKESRATATQCRDLADSSTQDEDGCQFFDTFEDATNTSETQTSIPHEETKR